ncbi:hypothetical protein HDU93_004450, partial [Gonapodya sp. JEL0774]
MDVANYGGIPDLTESSSAHPGSTSRALGPQIDMRWNIKEYLPPVIQPHFLKIIAELIFTIFSRKAEWLKKNPLGIIPASKRQPNHSTIENGDGMAVDEEDDEFEKKPPADQENVRMDHASEEARFKRNLIETILGRQLLSLVKDISRNVSAASAHTEEDRVAASFPVLPGSHLVMTNVALEFVKSVCAVLELDVSVEREVRKLKKSLLTLIGISDFSEQARFVNPCETVRLPRVICDYCNLCRDLDLCRDSDLLPDMSSGTAKPRPWLCQGCGTEHNKRAIEEELVDVVGRRLLSWQLQD